MAKYALVCGLNTYDKGAFRPLSFGINDAVRMKNLLSLCGYEVGILPGRKLQDTALRDSMKSMAVRAVRGDTLVFYFSGHGCSHAGEQYVLPYNASFGETRLERGVTLSEVADLTERPGVERVFIIDACRELFSSRGLTGEVADPISKKAILGIVDGRNDGSPLRIVCACSDGKYSYESAKLKGGVFTTALVELFIEAIERGRRLSLFDLVRDVDGRLEELAKRVDEAIPRQNPWLVGENITLVEGMNDPAFSNQFFALHVDIDSEQAACAICEKEFHFLDMMNCPVCGRHLCQMHFEDDETAFCRACDAEGLRVREKHKIVSITDDLDRRRQSFMDAFRNLYPDGIAKTGDQDAVRNLFDGICESLIAAMCEAEPGVLALEGIRMDMAIETFYGFTPLSFAKALSVKKSYALSEHKALWESCRQQLRRLVFWRSDARFWVPEWMDIPGIEGMSASMDYDENTYDLCVELSEVLRSTVLDAGVQVRANGATCGIGGIAEVDILAQKIYSELCRKAMAFLNMSGVAQVVVDPALYAVFGLTHERIRDCCWRAQGDQGEDGRVSLEFTRSLKQAFGKQQGHPMVSVHDMRSEWIRSTGAP